MDSAVYIVARLLAVATVHGAAVDRNGGWGLWSFWWPPCSQLGQGAIHNRSRLCNNPAPSGNGLNCPGEMHDSQHCPIDGHWGAWEPWQYCNNQCGRGTRTREHYCINPMPKYGGQNCPGPAYENKDCQYWHFKTCPGECYLCGDNEKCYEDTSTEKNFNCDCKPGYAKTGNSTKCQDVDECLQPDACGLNQMCENKIGSHICFCKEGFKLDKNTGNCISNYRPNRCHKVVGSYKCSCPKTYNDVLPGKVIVSHSKVELVEAPTPVTLKSRTYTCACYYCDKKVDIQVSSEYSKCDYVVKSPVCKRYLGDENAANHTFQYVPALMYDEMDILASVKVLTLSREAAQNLSNAEFSNILTEVAQDIVGGALNSDNQDPVTGENMGILADTDTAAIELMDAFSRSFPSKAFDIHTLDTDSMTTVRLTQASRDVDGNTYDCGNNGGPENNIWLSNAVIVQEKQNVLFTCISDPQRTLSARMYQFHPPLEGSEEYEAMKNLSHLSLSELNSAVISATTSPRPMKLLPADRVTISFRLFQQKREHYEPACAWYDFENKKWKLPDLDDDNGCEMVHVNSTYAVCACSHLTNFAVVMKHTPDPPIILELKQLDTAVIIGCSVCLLGALLALTLFFAVWKFPPDRVAHMNLAFCIVCLQLTFIAGSTATHDRVACKAVAILLHYLFTALFTWQLSDVILYVLFEVKKIRIQDGSFHVLSFAVGWGLPVLFVTIAVGTDFQWYGYGAHCWVHTEANVLWAQLIPIMLIVLCDICCLATLLRHLNLQPYEKDNPWFAKLMYHTKAAMFLLIISIVVWISGAYTMNNDTRVPSYLFSAVNGLMGCVVCVFYCISEPEVTAFLKKCNRSKKQKELGEEFDDGKSATFTANRSELDLDNNLGDSATGKIGTPRRHGKTRGVPNTTEIEAQEAFLHSIPAKFFALDSNRQPSISPLPTLPGEEDEFMWYVRSKAKQTFEENEFEDVEQPNFTDDPVTARGVLPGILDDPETTPDHEAPPGGDNNLEADKESHEKVDEPEAQIQIEKPQDVILMPDQAQANNLLARIMQARKVKKTEPVPIVAPQATDSIDKSDPTSNVKATNDQETPKINEAPSVDKTNRARGPNVNDVIRRIKEDTRASRDTDSRAYMGEFITDSPTRHSTAKRHRSRDKSSKVRREPSPTPSVEWGVPEPTSNVFVFAKTSDDTAPQAADVEEEHGWFTRQERKKVRSAAVRAREERREVDMSVRELDTPFPGIDQRAPSFVEQNGDSSGFVESNSTADDKKQTDASAADIQDDNKDDFAVDDIHAFTRRNKKKKKKEKKHKRDYDEVHQNEAFVADPEHAQEEEQKTAEKKKKSKSRRKKSKKVDEEEDDAFNY